MNAHSLPPKPSGHGMVPPRPNAVASTSAPVHAEDYQPNEALNKRKGVEPPRIKTAAPPPRPQAKKHLNSAGSGHNHGQQRTRKEHRQWLSNNKRKFDSDRDGGDPGGVPQKRWKSQKPPPIRHSSGPENAAANPVSHASPGHQPSTSNSSQNSSHNYPHTKGETKSSKRRARRMLARVSRTPVLDLVEPAVYEFDDDFNILECRSPPAEEVSTCPSNLKSPTLKQRSVSPVANSVASSSSPAAPPRIHRAKYTTSIPAAQSAVLSSSGLPPARVTSVATSAQSNPPQDADPVALSAIQGTQGNLAPALPEPLVHVPRDPLKLGPLSSRLSRKTASTSHSVPSLPSTSSEQLQRPMALACPIPSSDLPPSSPPVAAPAPAPAPAPETVHIKSEPRATPLPPSREEGVSAPLPKKGGLRFYRDVPPECRGCDPNHQTHRKAWAKRESSVLKSLGLGIKVGQKVIFRDDGMVLEWTSETPVTHEDLEKLVAAKKVSAQPVSTSSAIPAKDRKGKGKEVAPGAPAAVLPPPRPSLPAPISLSSRFPGAVAAPPSNAQHSSSRITAPPTSSVAAHEPPPPVPPPLTELNAAGLSHSRNLDPQTPSTQQDTATNSSTAPPVVGGSHLSRQSEVGPGNDILSTPREHTHEREQSHGMEQPQLLGQGQDDLMDVDSPTALPPGPAIQICRIDSGPSSSGIAQQVIIPIQSASPLRPPQELHSPTLHDHAREYILLYLETFDWDRSLLAPCYARDATFSFRYHRRAPSLSNPIRGCPSKDISHCPFLPPFAAPLVIGGSVIPDVHQGHLSILRSLLSFGPYTFSKGMEDDEFMETDVIELSSRGKSSIAQHDSCATTQPLGSGLLMVTCYARVRFDERAPVPSEIAGRHNLSQQDAFEVTNVWLLRCRTEEDDFHSLDDEARKRWPLVAVSHQMVVMRALEGDVLERVR